MRQFAEGFQQRNPYWSSQFAIQRLQDDAGGSSLVGSSLADVDHLVHQLAAIGTALRLRQQINQYRQILLAGNKSHGRNRFPAKILVLGQSTLRQQRNRFLVNASSQCHDQLRSNRNIVGLIGNLGTNLRPNSLANNMNERILPTPPASSPLHSTGSRITKTRHPACNIVARWNWGSHREHTPTMPMVY